jgi:hypothetical protein
LAADPEAVPAGAAKLAEGVPAGVAASGVAGLEAGVELLQPDNEEINSRATAGKTQRDRRVMCIFQVSLVFSYKKI